MTTCPKCRAETATPLCCSACGALVAPERAPTPFEVFGLEPGLTVDGAALKRRLIELSRRMHPDFFATGGDELRELAERNTAELNRAYEVLANELERADWLVRALGGPDERTERALPQAFLMEVLEWNESLEEARRSPASPTARRALESLAAALAKERERQVAHLRAALVPTPERGSPRLAEARKELNALRYVERTLGEIRALQLEASTAQS
ncbi:MAG: hypothetical protein L6Q99_09170 [Planctomycetes bacterium]|nr:hypothetical protein [Planctomycetota bacterium]